MKSKTASRFLGLISGSLLISSPFVASANFYVDYQGIDHKTYSAEELRRLKGAPDGYKVLTDKTFGVVHQIGKGSPAYTNSFGADIPLKDAVTMLMPEKWIAYIDENVESPNPVDWQAKNETWTDVLGRLGSNYGYRFIVDWDQKLLQISLDEEFTAPDYNDPVALKDEDTGRTIFVYSAKPITKAGVILVDGKAVSVKIIE